MIRTQLLLLFTPGKAWKELSEHSMRQQFILALLVYPLLLLSAASVYVRYGMGLTSLPEATKAAVLSLIRNGGSIVTSAVALNLLMQHFYHLPCTGHRAHVFVGYTYTIALLGNILSNVMPSVFSFVEFIPVYMIWIVYKGVDFLQIPKEDVLNFVITASAFLLGLPFLWDTILQTILK